MKSRHWVGMRKQTRKTNQGPDLMDFWQCVVKMEGGGFWVEEYVPKLREIPCLLMGAESERWKPGGKKVAKIDLVHSDMGICDQENPREIRV